MPASISPRLTVFNYNTYPRPLKIKFSIVFEVVTELKILLGTPHKGSDHFSVENWKIIQQTLHLRGPLPIPLVQQIRTDSIDLSKLNSGFKDLANNMRVWTFYETIDTKLDEGTYRAPVVPYESAVLGTKQELIYPIQNDHADCASFGLYDTQIMASYLQDKAIVIERARSLQNRFWNSPLRLDDKVQVEIVGFHPGNHKAELRMYTSKHLLSDFTTKGPERCLAERLKSEQRHGPDSPSPVSGVVPIRFKWIHLPFTNPKWVKFRTPIFNSA